MVIVENIDDPLKKFPIISLPVINMLVYTI